MFPVLETMLKENGISRKQIAECIHVNSGTVSQKMNGKYPFTFKEAVQIKNMLKTEIPVEELFKEFPVNSDTTNQLKRFYLNQRKGGEQDEKTYCGVYRQNY